MIGSARLVVALAALSAAVASALGPGKPVVTPLSAGNVLSRPPVPAKLHIKSFSIVSPVCGKPVDFQLEVENLSSGAFAGSTNINTRPGAVFTVTDTTTHQVLMLPLGSIGGGAALSIPASAPKFVASCPVQACWEAALLVLLPDSTTPNLPEWDGVKPSVCLKQSCNFEITGPLVRGR